MLNVNPEELPLLVEAFGQNYAKEANLEDKINNTVNNLKLDPENPENYFDAGKQIYKICKIIVNKEALAGTKSIIGNSLFIRLFEYTIELINKKHSEKPKLPELNKMYPSIFPQIFNYLYKGYYEKLSTLTQLSLSQDRQEVYEFLGMAESNLSNLLFSLIDIKDLKNIKDLNSCYSLFPGIKREHERLQDFRERFYNKTLGLSK